MTMGNPWRGAAIVVLAPLWLLAFAVGFVIGAVWTAFKGGYYVARDY